MRAPMGFSVFYFLFTIVVEGFGRTFNSLPRDKKVIATDFTDYTVFFCLLGVLGGSFFWCEHLCDFIFEILDCRFGRSLSLSGGLEFSIFSLPLLPQG